MRKFSNYLDWEKEVLDRGLKTAPIAQRNKSSKDLEMAFKLEDESYVDFGAFNMKRDFGVVCDTPEEFRAWQRF